MKTWQKPLSVQSAIGKVFSAGKMKPDYIYSEEEHGGGFADRRRAMLLA